MAVAAGWPDRVAGLVISGATAEPVGIRSLAYRGLATIFRVVPKPVLDRVNRWFFGWRFPPEVRENAYRLLDRTLAQVRISQQLSRVLFDMDENAAALALDRQVLALYSELLGPDHLYIAKALVNIAIALDAEGEFDEARALLLRSLSIKERTLDPDDPSVAITPTP